MAINNMNNGVVTMLDVLGWKGIYNRHSDPITDLRNIVESMNEDKNYKGLNGIDSHQALSISDTIVVITTYDEKTNYNDFIFDALDLHGRICSKAIATSINKQIPLRGATSIGEFSYSESIYVGKAIDEVASWHENADWIGVIMTLSAYFKAEGLKLKWWNNYNAPLKTGKLPDDAKCIDWCMHFDSYSKVCESLNKLQPLVPEISSKISNTLHFYKKCKPEEQL